MTATITRVPLLDLSRIHEPLMPELAAAFQRIVSANSYIMGSAVTEFEQACAELLQVKHAMGVSSGSDALLLALMVLGIGPGDEVICPSYTFFATAGAVSRLGATPVFVDCLPGSYNIDPQAAIAAVTPHTQAIIPVHLFGQSVDLAPLLALGKEKGIAIIEDAAQAIGSQYQGQPVGSLGTFGTFSFFPSKNLGGFGDGGLLTTQDDALAEKARILRTHGSKPKYYHHYVGGNFRLDALQAALLSVKLPHHPSYASQRQQLAATYQSLFEKIGITPSAPNNAHALSPTDSLQLPATDQPGHVWNQFIVRLPNKAQRDGLQQHLKANGIDTAIYYPIPLHLQPCFAELGYKPGSLPICEEASETTLALPIFPGLTIHEQKYVVGQIRAYLQL